MKRSAYTPFRTVTSLRCRYKVKQQPWWNRLTLGNGTYTRKP